MWISHPIVKRNKATVNLNPVSACGNAMLRGPLSALEVSNLENQIILILTIHCQNIYTPLFFLYIFRKVEYTFI